jgi:ubiquinone/menaquinone biosynthesis C-methylase UbiE
MNWRILLISFLENFRRVTERPLERLSEMGLKEGMTFLDVGCTLGFYSFYAASIVGEKGLVYALDINPNLIKYVKNKAGRKRIKNIRTFVANAQETGLPPKSVDMVFLHLVLHDIEDKPAAIREFDRILKKSGRLVIDEESAMPLGMVRKLAEDSGFTFCECLRKTIQIFEKTEKQYK